VFHRFWQTKFAYGASILSSRQILPYFASATSEIDAFYKSCKIDSKIILSLLLYREIRRMIQSFFPALKFIILILRFIFVFLQKTLQY
jgi:hypothetical protein